MGRGGGEGRVPSLMTAAVEREVSNSFVTTGPKATTHRPRANSSEPPCIVAAFVVNSEPHTGARPSVRLSVKPVLARCFHITLVGRLKNLVSIRNSFRLPLINSIQNLGFWLVIETPGRLNIKSGGMFQSPANTAVAPGAAPGSAETCNRPGPGRQNTGRALQALIWSV
jgi:hypothetical protein